MCQAYRKQYGCDYISAMPTNLYGQGDNYDLVSSHVIAALIAKAHGAKQSGSKELVVWGTGSPRREFMYVDDVADALVFLMENYSDDDHVNIGVGSDLTIRELAEIVIKVVGLAGEIKFDTTKPDGTPRKLHGLISITRDGLGSQNPFGTRARDGLRRLSASERP